MCSIIGYKGQLNVAPLLVHSLKRMEYRGYDSAGIAIINDGKVLVKKGVGNVSNVTDKFDFEKSLLDWDIFLRATPIVR
jgi:glucosamine--fructose-6-phosphate aminotransferase (isomerizing)